MAELTAPRDEPVSYPVEESRPAYRSGRVIAVDTDRVRMPDGGTALRDVVRHPGAVGVVALDDEQRVLLVQQYRHPVRHKLWEVPAGLLDQPGEPPLQAAQRELVEEAGFQAGRWWTLVDAFTTPGASSEAIRVYLARDLAAVQRPAGIDEERDMPVRWLPLADAVAGVLSGRLHNPMTALGILAAVRVVDDPDGLARPAEAAWPELGLVPKP